MPTYKWRDLWPDNISPLNRIELGWLADSGLTKGHNKKHLGLLATGAVTSLARPGGKVTGFVVMEGAIAGKWLELLKEIAPRVKRSPCSIRQRQHRPNVPESRASRVSETVPPSGRESLRKPVRRSASLGSAPAQ
jgi:hypothetical protein